MTNSTSPQNGSFDLSVDYIKSQFFRVVYAEGIWGGLTGNNKIHLAFWNSREAIPRRVQYRVNESGDVEETDRLIRADLVREIEVGVLMDFDTARTVRDWLNEMISGEERGTSSAANPAQGA